MRSVFSFDRAVAVEAWTTDRVRLIRWDFAAWELCVSGWVTGRVYLGLNLDTGELLAVKQLEYMEHVEAVRGTTI